MYRLVILYDQHTKSTYTHETKITVSQKFNFPIKYSVVANVILAIDRHGPKLKHLRNFKINVVAQFRDMWIVGRHIGRHLAFPTFSYIFAGPQEQQIQLRLRQVLFNS